MSGFYFCIICIVCVLAECFCVFVISAARSPCLYSGRTDSCVYYPDFISGKLIPFICYSAVRATLAALIHSQMICLVFKLFAVYISFSGQTSRYKLFCVVCCHRFGKCNSGKIPCSIYPVLFSRLKACCCRIYLIIRTCY